MMHDTDTDVDSDLEPNEELPTETYLHKLEKIPRNVNIKERFEEHYKDLLKDDYDKFMNYSLSYIRKCIRVNTLKATPEEIKARLSARWNLLPIPWCKDGFWIEFKDGKRFDLGNLIEHHLGYVYVQESASMLPPVILDPQPGELILDMCAAPGSKTSQIAMYMQNKGLLVANDISGSRLKALGMNLQRCGIHNAMLTMMQETRFTKIAKTHENFRFDRVLVDAPCSGTGTIRKSLRSLTAWNPSVITKLSKIQGSLLNTAYNIVKPGGVIVYSTCTLEPEENEAVVTRFLKEHPDVTLEPINKQQLGITYTPCITTFKDLDIDPQVENCLRIHPYDNNSEGFFVAKFRKSL